jgi:hypothetical protein
MTALSVSSLVRSPIRLLCYATPMIVFWVLEAMTARIHTKIEQWPVHNVTELAAEDRIWAIGQAIEQAQVPKVSVLSLLEMAGIAFCIYKACTIAFVVVRRLLRTIECSFAFAILFLGVMDRRLGFAILGAWYVAVPAMLRAVRSVQQAGLCRLAVMAAQSVARLVVHVFFWTTGCVWRTVSSIIAFYICNACAVARAMVLRLLRFVMRVAEVAVVLSMVRFMCMGAVECRLGFAILAAWYVVVPAMLWFRRAVNWTVRCAQFVKRLLLIAASSVSSLALHVFLWMAGAVHRFLCYVFPGYRLFCWIVGMIIRIVCLFVHLFWGCLVTIRRVSSV